jgi:phage terminase large subunit GpA-like protein
MNTVLLNQNSIVKTSDYAKRRIARLINEAIQKNLSEPPKLNLVEWADKFRYLPSNSAESGRWKTYRVEAARQPMLSVTDPVVKEVTIMSCIQFMKTELMLNTAMYYMHQEPSPIMYVAPKKETAEAWSKERLVQSVNCTPVLSDIFTENRRGQGNTITQKQFAGGQISIVSARNPTDLAMRACRIMLFDEIDKYPINVGSGEGGSGGEGDPITVAWGRSTTYGKRAKKIVACSPTVEGKSRIAQEYAKSNQCVFFQKCRHCGHYKVLDWTDVHIPKGIKTGRFQHKKAGVVCKNDGCGVMWSESDRHYSIKHGYWKALKPKITWHHGYKISALASPFTPIVELAKEFSDAQGNPESLKAFYNTRMAETWKERGEQPDWERVYERREKYKIATIPKGALLTTCGVDVQQGYLAYEVVGWGRKKHSWSIESGIIDGDISDDNTKELLSNFLDRTYKNSEGVNVPIMKACIDSGYNTQEVYSFVRQYGSNRVVAVKGDKEGNLKTILGTPKLVDVNVNGVRITRGLKNWMVGSSVIKEQFYRWLNCKKPTDEALLAGGDYPTGYCHYPEYDEEFFKQWCSEQRIQKTDNRGYSLYIWEKLRKDNHFLDCRVYSRAGSAMLQIDRMTESDWLDLEVEWGVADKPKPVLPVLPEVSEKSKFIKRQSDWIKRR